MKLSRVLSLLVTLLVALVAISMIAGAVFGYPIGVTYVETGSMEPTINTGDGFISVPPAVAGPVEQGDVIVFDAVDLHGGGLVTHRVVGETSEGYITQGDANPVTDQDGAEPPVQDGQIRGVAFEIGNDVVTIPRLGLIVMGSAAAIESGQQFLAATFGTRAFLGTQGLIYILLGFGIVTYVLASVAENTSDRKRDRRTSRWTGAITPGTVIVTMTVVLVIALTLSMVIPAGPHTFQFVSSETDSERADVIQQGTTQEITYIIPSNGPFPVVGVVESTSDGTSVSPSHVSVEGGQQENVTVTIEAPEATGTYTESIHEYRYLALLPTGTILTLYEIHPWTPIIVINVMIGTLFVLIAVLLIGTDPIRLNRRRDPLPLRVQIRRWLK